MYSMKSRVRYSEADSGQKMTFQALTNYLQDCCIFQSEDLGIGVDYLKEHAQAWFLASWQIVVERLPVLGEKITVKTWPYNFKGFYGYRNFTIEDAEGKICAYADSQWIFMDLKRERPVRISDKMLEEYQMEEPFKMDYADRKIKLPEKMQEQETDSNVYSAKTSAETQLKMWDGELSTVYNALLEALPQEEAQSLANEERDWLKKRESDAADSSGKSGNSLSYASSMVNQTRERAYELAKRCDALAEEN